MTHTHTHHTTHTH